MHSVHDMNITDEESDLVKAKTCGNDAEQKITYSFSESYHSLCLDKKDIVEKEIQACETLINYSRDESEKAIVEKEIAELRMALDMLT
jgi:hypothetical protein